MIGCQFNQTPEEIFFNVMALARFYRDELGNVVMGNLHVVLSDGNLEYGYIIGCREDARKALDHVGVALAECLLEMSMQDRQELYKQL